ncbi:MAG TPA: c-type cytochrome [Burkholderiales bacterium]|nr:c-type cytochrome [Burkholderiales bacterium]
MEAHDPHQSFIKTPKQLIVVILLAFLVPIIGIILLVQLVLSGARPDPQALTPEAVERRIAPVARLEFGPPEGVQAAAAPAKPAAPGKPGAVAGKSVYDKVCVACHQVSVAGSPRLGDKAAWAPRIQTGVGSLMQSVIKGKGAMPPRAGNPSLSDAEIRAAVEFMVGQSK